MDRIAGPLMDKATSRLTQADVLEVIKPAWETTNETARRVLGRIDQTIEHAIAVDPARFNGSNPCINVLRFLPRVSAIVKRRPAMPWQDLPGIFAGLRPPGHTGTRTVVALLLPKNQRGHPGDVERDRRQPMERARRAHEIRGRADDPPEHRCGHSARPHQAGSQRTRHAPIWQSPTRRIRTPDGRRHADADPQQDGPEIHRPRLSVVIHGLGRGGSSSASPGG